MNYRLTAKKKKTELIDTYILFHKTNFRW